MIEFPRLYSDFAKYYDRLESQYRDYELEARWLGEIFDSHRSKKVIDISCGTGNHLLALAKKESTDRELSAMDASKQMIEIASSKVKSNANFVRADFLSIPFGKGSFDCAICMYWSLAGLTHEQVKKLFSKVHSILEPGGIFVFDVENSEGIKENLLNEPFIDAFFEDGEGNSVTRANLSRRVEPDLVDWHAYYLIERGGVTELSNDNMKLRFYSRQILTNLIKETGFALLEVSSGPFIEYRERSPSLYFVAQVK